MSVLFEEWRISVEEKILKRQLYYRILEKSINNEISSGLRFCINNSKKEIIVFIITTTKSQLDFFCL